MTQFEEEILKNYEKTATDMSNKIISCIKKLTTILTITIILLFLSNMIWLYVFQLYDYIEVSANGDGNAIYTNESEVLIK